MVGLSSCVCGPENWLLIDLFLFVTKMAAGRAGFISFRDIGKKNVWASLPY